VSRGGHQKRARPIAPISSPGRKGPSFRSSMGATGALMVELTNDRLVIATKMEPSVADIVRPRKHSEG
jgi:hypothetical protein